MAYNFDVSILNPLRFFQLSDNLGASLQTINYATFDANYQTRDFDKDFFARNIPNYDRQTTYCQPYQQGDVIRVQFLGLQNDGTINQYLLDVINLKGQSVLTASPTQGATPISGQYITEFNVPLINVPEGEYFVSIRYRKLQGLSFIYTYLISEPISVKQSHPNTLLFEYENSYNTQGIIFEELSAPFHFRVHSALTELNPESKFTTYEDEPLNLEMLSGTPYRLWTLGIGGNGNPIPQWVADKIERITLCDTLKIDGKLYTRNEGAKLEANRKQRTPLFSWKLTLREKVNDNNLYIADYQQNKVIVADYVEGASTIYARDLVTTTTYQIRQFFNGYTGLLQYLNGAFKTANNLGGTFGIDAEKRLVYTPSSTAEATQFATPSLKILPYTLEFNVVANSGTDFDLIIDPPTGGSTTYAIQYEANNGAITYGTSSALFNLTNTYNQDDNRKIRVAFDKVKKYRLAGGTTLDILSLSGYLTADCVEFRAETTLLYSIENNIFRYLTALNTDLIFESTLLQQDTIDNILKWLYVTEGLQNSVVNLLQTPNVPCSDDVAKNIVPYLIARGLTIYTNNQFTPSAPVNIALPAITGTFNPGNYITASNGTWTGYPTPAYTRVWQFSTNGGATWSNFSPSQTGTQYLIQAGDVGRLIRCVVTATNPSGVVTVVSNSVLITALAGSAPYPTALPVVSGTAVVGSLLTTTDGTWGGTTPITYTYQWLRNGVAIGGATSATYTTTNTDLGRNVQCQVTATNANGANTGESNVIVPTQAPSNTTAPIAYGNLTTGQVLTAYVGEWSAFPAPTYSYQWQRSTNGGATWTNLVGSTNATYTIVTGDVGNALRCQVTANNGISPNATANTQQVNVPATYVPVSPSVATNPQINIITTQIAGQYLEVTDGVWNGDAPITFAYQWRKNGTIISGATGSTYLIVSGDYTASITCTVTATNAVGATAFTTTGVTIQQPPIQTAGASISGTYATGNTISASIGTWTGSATITYAFQWYRSGAVITGATSSTYTLVTADEDTTLSVIITASNSWGSVATNAVGNQYIYTAEYQAVLTFATAQGYTLPSLAQRIQHNKMVIEMKAIGDWTIMDRIYQFKNVGSQNFALINWRNPTVGTLLVLNNTPTWSDTLGFTGGGTAFLDTQFNPATAGGNYTQNNAGRYAYVTARLAEGTTYQIDGNAFAADNGMQCAVTSTNNRINQGTTAGTSVSARTIGFHSITRTSSTVSSRGNDVLQAMTVTSSAMTSSNQLILRSGASYSTLSVGFYAIGGAIPDADIPSFRAVLNKYFAV